MLDDDDFADALAGAGIATDVLLTPPLGSYIRNHNVTLTQLAEDVANRRISGEQLRLRGRG
jgi:hypothetical protein